MKRFLPLFAILFLLSAGTIFGQNCILLKNRSMLEGTVLDMGETYRVSFPQGGSMAMPRDQVEFIGAGRQEVYVYLSRGLHVRDDVRRQELIEWCLKYDLIDQADTEIAILERSNPGLPILEMLKRRRDVLQKTRIAQAVTESVYSGENSPAQEIPEERGLTSTELERMARSLPPDALTMYVNKIQPIFTKNCMTSGCHGPDSTTDFRLTRSANPSRSATLRNMHSALQQINLTNPEASPLLRKPVMRHGKDDRVIFISRDYATYQMLIAWTYLVARNEYVIPREAMVPTVKPRPTVSPSSHHGLQQVTVQVREPEGVVREMYGVSPALYPQNLYPSEYRSLYETPAQPAGVPRGIYIPEKSPEENPGNLENLFHDDNFRTASQPYDEPGPDAMKIPVFRKPNGDYVSAKAPGQSVRQTDPRNTVIALPLPNDMTPRSYPEMMSASDGVRSSGEGANDLNQQYMRALQEASEKRRAEREARAANPEAAQENPNSFQLWRMELERIQNGG